MAFQWYIISNVFNSIFIKYNFKIFLAILVLSIGYFACSVGEETADVLPAEACFTMSKSSCELGDCSISFDASCSENAVSYNWGFGDGNTREGKITNHTYDSIGLYTVTLEIEGIEHSTFISQKVEVKFACNIVVDFNIQDINGNRCFLPCNLEFSNLSMNANEYTWSFGNGETSTIVNPIHSFTSPGAYTIELKAKNEYCERTHSITINVSILTFEKTFGRVKHEEGFALIKTKDGGYALIGTTASIGAGKTDVYFVRTDNTGEIIWEKTYGGAEQDFGYDILQTEEGSFVISGHSWSDPHTGIYMLKISESGNIAWEKSMGGIDGRGIAVQKDNDGYVTVGHIFRNAADIYLWETGTFTGTTVNWEYYGGDNTDVPYDIIATKDGGLAIAGETNSFGLENRNAYLIKTNSVGWKDWENHYGGEKDTYGLALTQSKDEGYIIVGGIEDSYNKVDIYLVKTDVFGNIEWENSYGRNGYDVGNSIALTNDDGYIIAGSTNSQRYESGDVYLMKVDQTGEMIWERTFGGRGNDYANSVIQTDDGGYAILGTTSSLGEGEFDFYLIKTNAEGKIE